jgi:GT2 family glycosyltransferase
MVAKGLITESKYQLVPDVSIILINFNTAALTLACLESVYHYTANIHFEVILVDNASTECDPIVFKDRFPGIKLIQNNENSGFARGNNIGIRHASGRYVLLLNSDMELKSNAIYESYIFLETMPSAGVCSIRLIYPDGRHQSVAQRFPSIRYRLVEFLRIQKLLGGEAGGRLLLGSFFNHHETVKADWVWGAFFMFRHSILGSLPNQKLNEEYFMYGEDMQWCFDFSKRGWEIWFLGNVEALHHMGGSAGNKSLLMKEGIEHFYRKNYRWHQRSCIRFVDKLLKL